MTLADLLPVLDEFITVQVKDAESGLTLSEYDGRNGIDEALSDCPVDMVTADGGMLAVYVIRPD